jgi:hypothetical protein
MAFRIDGKLETRRRPKRTRKKTTFFHNDDRFMWYRRTRGSSVNKETTQKRHKGSAVQNCLVYDPKRGSFLRVLEEGELKELEIFQSASKKRISAIRTARMPTQEPLKSKNRLSGSILEESTTQKSIQNALKYKVKTGEIARVSGKIVPTLWKLHHLDEAKTTLNLEHALSRKLRKRAVYIGEFMLFCHERQCIWAKRKQGMPEPWTQDPILQSKHFTNIYRELDAGTAFFRRSMIKLKEVMKKDGLNREEFENHFAVEVLWASFCYRLVGRVDTFNELGGIPTLHGWEQFSDRFERHYRKEKTVFTAAYQNMGFNRFIETIKFIRANNDIALKDLATTILISGRNRDLKRCTQSIQQIPNIGPFFAWQVTCDLMECGILKGVDEDTSNYVQLGPGAKRGLKIIFGSSRRDENALCIMLREKQNVFFNCLGVKFIRFDNRIMSLKVLEHALCEYSKYYALKTNSFGRVFNGLGGSAAKFDCEECATLHCENNGSQRCDTCWRNFCHKCSNNEGDITRICNDCRELPL